MLSHILLTPPTVEPVSLDEVKSHARIDHNVDDVLLGSLLFAARQWCEHYTRRAFINQTWDLALSVVPEKRYVNLPRSPLESITHVQLFDDNDNAKTWDEENYFADTVSDVGRLYLREGACWPDASRCSNGVVITYVAGYGIDGSFVPEPIKLAIKQLVLHWYEYRGDAVQSNILSKAPLTVEALLDPYRILSLGRMFS